MFQFLKAIDVTNMWGQSIFAAVLTAHALMRCGPRVRVPIIVNGVCFAASSTANLLIKPLGPHLLVTYASDTALAVGLLYFALKYDSAWLSLAVVAQGLMLAMETFTIGRFHGAPILQQFAIGVVLNVFSALVLIGVLGFAISERRRLALAGPLRVYAPTSARRPGPAAGGAS
jgi:hypothetical protein